MKNRLQFLIYPGTLLLLAILFLWSCQSLNDSSAKNSTFPVNQEITSEEGELILVGRLNRDAWKTEACRDWFETEYQSYTVEEKTLATLPLNKKGIEIKVFLGTWCSDSQREIPRLYKILDFVGFDDNRLHVVGLVVRIEPCVRGHGSRDAISRGAEGIGIGQAELDP